MRQMRTLVTLIVGMAMGLTAPMHAQAVELSGFVDLIYGGSNQSTTNFVNTVAAEVDIADEVGGVAVRLDLDIAATGLEATGAPGLDPVHQNNIGIEQARFDMGLPGVDGVTLTGGVFNAPIGFEAQDAPDMLQTTNGLLFGLVPSNLAGLMVSGQAGGMVDWNLYLANDPTGAFKTSVGGLVSVAPIPGLGLDVGYITQQKAAAGTGQGGIIDIVIQYTGMENVLGVIEILTDSEHTGFGITGNYAVDKWGATIRFDNVKSKSKTPAPVIPLAIAGVPTVGACELGTTTTSQTCSTITIAGSYMLAENVSTVLEFKNADPGAADSVNDVTLEFVLTF